MPTGLLSCGYPYTITQNVVYALPVVKTTVFCGDSAPTLEQSNTVDFTAKSAVTLTAGQAQLAGGFIRSTGPTPVTIILSRD